MHERKVQVGEDIHSGLEEGEEGSHDIRELELEGDLLKLKVGIEFEFGVHAHSEVVEGHHHHHLKRDSEMKSNAVRILHLD